MGTKPSLEEVLKYAEPLIMKFIGEEAADLPFEQKEEIQQSARLRILKIYERLDADAGWKSFVYNHSRGAVLDYIKFGAGFQESKWSITKPEDETSKSRHKMRDRISLAAPDGTELDVEQVAGFHGAFSELKLDSKQIRWSLVERMASIDPPLHMIALFILGNGIEDMAPGFDLCRSRVGQLIQAFVDRFDDPKWAESPWLLQTCYAFNICDVFGLPDVDQSTIHGNGRCGWELTPIELEIPPAQAIRQKQLTLFPED